MSTSYYLVQTEPTQLYGQAKVAQKSCGKTFLWYDAETEWVNADGCWAGTPDITVPASMDSAETPVQDHFAEVRKMVRLGSGAERDVEEVFG